jgi:hypothetical protein
MTLKSSLFAIGFILLNVAFAEAVAEATARALVQATGPSHHLRPSFEIKIRAPPTPTVDFSSLPYCAQYSCFAATAIPLPCAAQNISCPDDATKNCVTYPLDCFCGLNTPLACAWSCTWFKWFLTEDWFASPQACPGVPPVDFSGLPSCAQSCVADASFQYGCITAGRSCFCTHGSLYSCDAKCQAQSDVDQIVSWFQAQCKVDYGTAYGALSVNRSSIRGQGWTVPEGRNLHWYEIMAIVVAAATLVAYVAAMILLSCVSKGEPKTAEENGSKQSRIPKLWDRVWPRSIAGKALAQKQE